MQSDFDRGLRALMLGDLRPTETPEGPAPRPAQPIRPKRPVTRKQRKKVRALLRQPR